MQIHKILRCKFYGDETAVIFSEQKDPRLPDLHYQMKISEAFVIKQTGKKSWCRLRPEEASIIQRAIATTLMTAAGVGVGLLVPPYGAWIGGLIGFKGGLKFGGIGRLVPCLLMSKDKLYVGALPWWQVKKLTALIEVPAGNIEFVEVEG